MLDLKQLKALLAKPKLTKPDVEKAVDAIYYQCGKDAAMHEIFKKHRARNGLDSEDGNDAEDGEETSPLDECAIGVCEQMFRDLDVDDEDDWADKRGYQEVMDGVMESVYAGLT